MWRVVRQGLSLVGAFLLLWYALAQVDWVRLLPVEAAADATEGKVGEAVWAFVRRTNRFTRTPAIVAPVDTLVDHLCRAGRLRQCPVRIAVMQSDEVNAFALPDRRLIITTAMLAEVANESELAAVLAHELAHVERRHAMQALVKEFGIAVLLSMSGSGQTEGLRDVVKLLSSTAHSRALESEADLAAVGYLADAHVAIEPFADLIYRLGAREDAAPRYLVWLASHPDYERRAQALLDEASRRTVQPEPVLSATTWDALKDAVRPTSE